MIVGILSDTHGALSPQAIDALSGAGHIIHAGDVGGPDIVAALERIAPVTVVRGNTDGGPFAKRLPLADMVTLAGTTFYVVHDLYTLDLDPAAAGVQVVVTGHTHRPEIKTADTVLYLNPGSASQSRDGLGLSVARIHLTFNGLRPEIVHLRR